MEMQPYVTAPSPAVNNAVCRLYVEGSETSLDTSILDALFRKCPVHIRAIGSCNSVESVAQAFAKEEPKSFFLIDRDHYHKEKDLDWNRFQTGETNLLIWQKKELENYFIDPDFLIRSEFLREGATLEQLRSQVLGRSQKRLYLDVANYVIVSMRESMKENWINILTNPNDCPDVKTALVRILHHQSLEIIKQRVNKITLESEVESRFHSYLHEMTGDSETLQYDKGKWLDMVSGKSILEELMNNSGLFQNSRNGEQWVGRERMIDIARFLISEVNENHFPQDFTKLKRLVLQRARQLPSQKSN